MRLWWNLFILHVRRCRLPSRGMLKLRKAALNRASLHYLNLTSHPTVNENVLSCILFAAEYNLTNWLINMARLFHHHRKDWHGHVGTRGQPEESRAAILKAAAHEFAEHGIAGARTDAIAREAHVNKALLYYYFKDKETLYGAVLDEAFSGLKTTVFQVLDGGLAAPRKNPGVRGRLFRFHCLEPALSAPDAARNDACPRR